MNETTPVKAGVCRTVVAVQRVPNPNDFGYLTLLHIALVSESADVENVSRVVCVPEKATAPELACYFRRFADAIEGKS